MNFVSPCDHPPGAKNHCLLIVENPTDLPFHIHHLGWWDRGLHSDWVIAKPVMRAGRWRQLVVDRAGSYDHFWQAGSETSIDTRGGPMLGPKRIWRPVNAQSQ